MAAAAAHLDRLTKPPGSLGRLEGIAIDLAGITGRPAPAVDRRAIVVAAADHGVARQGVSAYPAEVTAQMVANFVGRRRGDQRPRRGSRGAARGPRRRRRRTAARPSSPSPGVDLPRRCGIRAGTADLSARPGDDPRRGHPRPSGSGWSSRTRLAADGVELLGVGEMGIGNTTAASAIVGRPDRRRRRRGDRVAGPGSTTPAGHTRSPPSSGRWPGTGPTRRPIRSASSRRSAASRSAPCAACCIGAAAAGIPVVLDGFITGAAALVASALAPDLPPRLFAGHRSVEPGHAVVLARLWRDPLLDLDLRLGEGTGAALAMGLVVGRGRDSATGWRRSMTPPCPARPDVAPPTVALVRHASTAWSGHRYGGRSDPPLDADGTVAAAAMLADRLARHHRPDARIVSSPLRRALRDRGGHRRGGPVRRSTSTRAGRRPTSGRRRA